MVELQPHQLEWSANYAREAQRISTVLGQYVEAIEHIGSTAVPGLVAKPIIDLALCASPAMTPSAIGPLLEPLGYLLHTAGPKTHAVYVRSTGERRSHILHAFTVSQWEHCNQRLFRDKLLHDSSARARYDEVKRSLASASDGRDYTRGKADIIQELLNEERADRGLGPVDAWEK